MLVIYSIYIFTARYFIISRCLTKLLPFWEAQFLTRVMEIPSLATCQRMKYENELLRKKILKLRNERDSMKHQLEGARVSGRNNFEPPSTAKGDNRDSLIYRKDNKDADVDQFPLGPECGLTTGNKILTGCKDDLEDDDADARLMALANGREPRPQKILTDEGNRLRSLIDVQNKVIQRYEAQLKGLKEQVADHQQMKSDNEALKLENDLLKRELANRKADDGTGEERIALLLRELSGIKREKEQLFEERRQLRAELSSIDPEFFEEIEDLKFSLVRTRRLNEEYEKTIRVLSNKLGISPPLGRKNQRSGR